MNYLLVLLLMLQTVAVGHHRIPLGTGGTGPVVVNSSTVGNTPVVGAQTTHTFGFSTGSSHFLVAVSTGAVGLGNSIDSATLEPSSTAMTCPTASKFNGDRNYIAVCYLANAPSGQTSVQWSYTGSNGVTVSQFLGEYSNMSLTAAPVNTTVHCNTGFVTTASWTCGPYTATSNNLVWTTCSPNTVGPTTITQNSPWNTRSTWDTGTRSEFWFYDILGPSSGSYTGGGTFSIGASSGAFYDCETGSYT